MLPLYCQIPLLVNSKLFFEIILYLQSAVYLQIPRQKLQSTFHYYAKSITCKFIHRNILARSKRLTEVLGSRQLHANMLRGIVTQPLLL